MALALHLLYCSDILQVVLLTSIRPAFIVRSTRYGLMSRDALIWLSYFGMSLPYKDNIGLSPGTAEDLVGGWYTIFYYLKH